MKSPAMLLKSHLQIGCGLLIAVVALALVLAVSFPRATFRLMANRPTEAQLIQSLGGDQVVAVLRNYERAEIALISPPEDGRQFPPNEYREIANPLPLSAEIAGDISRTLIDRRENVDNSTKKSCAPRYGVRVSFFAGADRVDVYFCFECSIFAVCLNGKPVGGNDFELAYRKLIGLVRKVYPDHEGLAELEARWRY